MSKFEAEKESLRKTVKDYMQRSRFFDNEKEIVYEQFYKFLRNNAKSEPSANYFVAGYIKHAISRGKIKKPWYDILERIAPLLKLDEKSKQDMRVFLAQRHAAVTKKCTNYFAPSDAPEMLVNQAVAWYQHIRDKAKNIPVQTKLFEEFEPKKETLDKRAFFNMLSKFYESKIEKKKENDFIEIVKRALTENSFTPEEQAIIAEQTQRPEILDSYSNVREKQVEDLNAWAKNQKPNGELWQYSVRSTYINILFERIGRDKNIADINPNQHCTNHHKKIIGKIFELEKSDKLHYSHAKNKITKELLAWDKDALKIVQNIIENPENDKYCYNEALNILAQFDGGENNRKLKLPLIPRWRE